MPEDNKPNSRQYNWIMKMKEEGRCVTCGKLLSEDPKPSKNHCEVHKKAVAALVLARYHKRKLLKRLKKTKP